MEELSQITAYVVHVRENNEARRTYITEHLSSFGIQADLMLKADMSDLTPELLAKYFRDDMADEPKPQNSCTLKHLYIYEKVLNGPDEHALIFEDDIELSRNFRSQYQSCLDELYSRDEINSTNYLISLENNNQFVSRSEQQPDTLIYPKAHGRFAGAYVISKSTAKAILDTVAKEKCHLIIDWFHNYLADKGIISIYWMHPTIAQQGSHSGKFKSLIDDKKTGLVKRVAWAVQSFIKNNFTRRMR